MEIPAGLLEGSGDEDRELGHSEATDDDEGPPPVVMAVAARRHNRGEEGSEVDDDDGGCKLLPPFGECERGQLRLGEEGRKPKRGLGDEDRCLAAGSLAERPVDWRCGIAAVCLCADAVLASAQTQKFSQLPGR